MLDYVQTDLQIKAFDFKERTFDAVAAGIGNVDEGRDMFITGSFKRSINGMVKAGKVKFLDAHPYKYTGVPSTKFILGKVVAAFETEKELVVRIFVSDTPDGNDLLTKIKDGVVDALSVGYLAIKQHFEKDDEGKVFRVLEEVKLMEVSAVIWGMNDRATIDALSVKEKEEREERKKAKALTYTATLAEATAEDALWKSNRVFNETINDIISDETIDGDGKAPLLQKALDDYKDALSKLLGLEEAELTDKENEFIIRANEPMAALLKGAMAHGEADKGKPVPPESEGTRTEEETIALKARVTNLRLTQLES
jgi:HK97 family phage prohead protease